MHAMASRRTASAAARKGRAARDRIRSDLEGLCRDAGVSQAALARASGVPQSYVSRILAGSVRPTLETYVRLATALGADFSARIYPNTGPAIHDRQSVPILEVVLRQLHPRWKAFTEVPVVRPGRGWIDVVLYDAKAALLVAVEIESTLRRIEQLVRWSELKAESLPSWERWPTLAPTPSVSRALVVRWSRTNRTIVREAARQLRVAYAADPADALEALVGVDAWPGPALLWARTDKGGPRLVPE